MSFQFRTAKFGTIKGTKGARETSLKYAPKEPTILLPDNCSVGMDLETTVDRVNAFFSENREKITAKFHDYYWTGNIRSSPSSTFRINIYTSKKHSGHHILEFQAKGCSNSSSLKDKVTEFL